MPRLLLRHAWAPALVFIIHGLMGRFNYGPGMDFAFHFSGGASIAYFIHHALRAFEPWLGANTRMGRNLFTFALACAIGVFWELGERASDIYLHTNIQWSAPETLQDLTADALGATLAILLLGIIAQLRREPGDV